MNSKVLSLAAALALGGTLLSSSAARAETTEDHDSYLMVKFGPYFPTASNPIDAIGQSVQTWPTKWELDGALGHWWGILGLELDVGYLSTGSGPADFKAWPILAVAKIRLPLGFIAPYGEGGAGIAISSLSGVGGSSSTQTAFEGIAGAGVDFYIGQLLLGADFKYLWLNPSFTVTDVSGSSSSKNFNFSGITVQGYIGYRF
jgi:hypothetical protein